LAFWHTLFALYLVRFYHFHVSIKEKKTKSLFAPRKISLAPDMEAIQPFIAEVSSKVISTAEIAKLAAVLAQGRPIDSHSLTVIATQAIELWDKCEEARKKKIEKLAIYARAEAIDNALPKPESYPVGFEVFLRLLMPKKRSEDRMKFYREYLRGSLRFSIYMKQHPPDAIPFESIPIPSDEDIAAVISRERKDGFTESMYSSASRHFLRWMVSNEGLAKKRRGQAGALGLKTKRLQTKLNAQSGANNRRAKKNKKTS
jgi:hypothetical protein